MEQKTIQKNVQTLEDMGYTQVAPTEKLLACGDYGVGALAEPNDIVQQVKPQRKKEQST